MIGDQKSENFLITCSNSNWLKPLVGAIAKFLNNDEPGFSFFTGILRSDSGKQ